MITGEISIAVYKEHCLRFQQSKQKKRKERKGASNQIKRKVHFAGIIESTTIADLNEVDFYFFCYCNDFSGRKSQLVNQHVVFCLQPIVVQKKVTCVGCCYVICASFELHHGTALIKSVDDEALVYQTPPATRTHVNVVGTTWVIEWTRTHTTFWC